MSGSEIFLQQLIIGLSNGMIIALIALGYTMVYGIIELINFAHGDLFMLGSFLALTLVSAMGLATASEPPGFWILALISAPVFVVGWSMPPRFLQSKLKELPWLAAGITGLIAAV